MERNYLLILKLQRYNRWRLGMSKTISIFPLLGICLLIHAGIEVKEVPRRTGKFCEYKD